MSNWTTRPLPQPQHPSIIVGDFNSHHTNWGYNRNNTTGEQTNNWTQLNNLHPVYNPRDKGTFFSARWNREYTPNLVFVTKEQNQTPLPVKREILNDFLNSQHRPILITTGITIPMIKLLPKSRWNFQKANWEHYRDHIEKKHATEFQQLRKT
ncbi:uncharacterized protein LOC122243261 [Penaeus japonicus]|uniref:uncharacterized protein LOC122243261 n=1 Tax=Penaeus japonicus TaxID=27405 RepID=UPI001C710FC5|nr:uncharacterized protein LOC122243261 [Penaeus japonicus]